MKAVKKLLDIAMLPLADGRRLMLPMNAMVEVKQLPEVAEGANDLGSLNWRGMELPVQSLDAACGLPAPALENQRVVGIFRAAEDSEAPFRALAFCGTAAHGRINPEQLETTQRPAEGHFLGAAMLDNELYLIPDLPGLMYA